MKQNVQKTEILFEFLRVLIALLIAYAVVLICIALMFNRPLESLYYFIVGPFTSLRRFGNVIARMIPYMFTGAGMCFCYAAGRMNLAGEGGFMFSGCIITLLAMSISESVPHVPLILILLVAGGLCGIFAASIPALLREKLGTNELVVSLMMNYTLMYLSNYILKTYMQDRTTSYITSEPLPLAAKLSILIPKTDIHSGLFIGVALIIAVALIFYKTPMGLSIRICGENSDFARYTGIKMTGILISAQLLAGFLAGMGGAVEIMGNYRRYQWTALTQYGFDGLMVAVLARKNPVFIPLGAFLLAYMRIGANVLNFNTSVPIEFVQVMQAILIILIAAQTFLEKQKNSIIFKEAQSQMLLEKE
jgi:simple sugar transport system permease protein